MIFILIIFVFVLICYLYTTCVVENMKSDNLLYKKKKLLLNIGLNKNLKQKLYSLVKKVRDKIKNINIASGHTKATSLDDRINIHLDLYKNFRKDLIGF